MLTIGDLIAVISLCLTCLGFRPELIVVDVPYSPLETKMRKMAKEVGCKTMNGLGMMLFQGAAAFKLWTGQDMPIEHIKEVLNIRYED